METKEILQEAVEKYTSSEIDSSQDVSGHTNDTFLVKLKNGEEIVCTICTGDNPLKDCKKEVAVNKYVEDETNIPTLTITYSRCEETNIPPYYITRRVKGINGQELLENRTDKKLTTEQRKRLTRNIGKLIGKLHSKITFPEAGEIVVKNCKPAVKDGKQFKEFFSNQLEEHVEKLGSTNFSDMKEDVREAINQAMKIIDNPPEHSMIHHDIRPDNMILNGLHINALLDFEHVTSGHILRDIAHTELHVAEPHLYYDIQKPEKLRVQELRKELKKGYQQENKLPKNYRRQIETFKLTEHIRYMNSFESYAKSVGMAEEERKRNMKDHKQQFRKMKRNIQRPENVETILK